MPAAPRAPGPRGLPLTGSLWWVRKDVLGFIDGLRDRYGAVVRLRLGPEVLHLLCEPVPVLQVLQDRSRIYDRVTPHNAKLRDITGQSLLTTDGAPWRRRRRLLAPAFTPRRIAGAVPFMARHAESMLERWCGGSGGTVETAPEIQALTCAIIIALLAGREPGGDGAVIEPALAAVLAHHQRRVQSLFDLPHRLPTASRRAFHRGVAAIDGVVRGLIDERRRAGERRDDPLDGLLDAEARGELSGRDEMITLLLAGHETTANALAWSLALLAEHPEEQEALRDEARRVLGDGEPDAAALPGLRRARRAFEEAMRLYPPIWLLDRLALEDDVLGGFRIPAGSTVVIPQWTLHRHPKLWEDPLAFRPQRFVRRPEPGAYLPFGAGPHGCIGARLAMAEGPLLLALIARRLRWHLDGSLPEPDPGLTLRMRTPLRLRLEVLR